MSQAKFVFGRVRHRQAGLGGAESDTPIRGHAAHHRASARHVPDETMDNAWIPKIAGQGWIVISADRGKGKKRGGKLPMICQANGVTCLMLGNRVHHLPNGEENRGLGDGMGPDCRLNEGAGGFAFSFAVERRGAAVR